MEEYLVMQEGGGEIVLTITFVAGGRAARMS